MTIFEIPNNNVLAEEFAIRTNGFTSKIRRITGSDYALYDMRATRNVEKRLKSLNSKKSDVQISYGILKELSWYCTDVAFYFEDKRARKIMRTLGMEINNFCEFYFEFLL